MVYFPQKSVKGQSLSNFLVDHPSLEIKPEKDVELGIYEVEMWPWVLIFDGSSKENSVGAEIVIISPKGIKTTLSFKCSKNQAKYEALMIGFKILLELGEQEVHIIGDYQLVPQQLTGEYKCNNLL